jgi:hypothetical protein
VDFDVDDPRKLLGGECVSAQNCWFLIGITHKRFGHVSRGHGTDEVNESTYRAVHTFMIDRRALKRRFH